MKKIFITGGCGLIGRSVVKRLLMCGLQLIILDNQKLKGFDKFSKNKNLKFIQGDCRNFNLVDDLVGRSDAIIHLAAPASFLKYKEDPTDSTLNTIQSFINVMEAAKKHKIKKVIHASTSAVYEGNDIPYVETMRLNPPDLKAQSKKFSEDVGRQYSDRFGIISIALRPFSVYGDDETEKKGYANVISLFVWAMFAGKRPVVWGDGFQTRDYIHSDDIAEAFRLAFIKDIPTQEINVGAGIETSFNKVVNLINKKLGTKLKPQYVPIPIDIYARRLLANTRRAERVLGFKPKIDLEAGITRVIQNAKIFIKKEPALANSQMYYKTIK